MVSICTLCSCTRSVPVHLSVCSVVLKEPFCLFLLRLSPAAPPSDSVWKPNPLVRLPLRFPWCWTASLLSGESRHVSHSKFFPISSSLSVNLLPLSPTLGNNHTFSAGYDPHRDRWHDFRHSRFQECCNVRISAVAILRGAVLGNDGASSVQLAEILAWGGVCCMRRGAVRWLSFVGAVSFFFYSAKKSKIGGASAMSSGTQGGRTAQTIDIGPFSDVASSSERC